MSTFKLISSDGQEFSIPSELVNISTTLKEMAEDVTDFGTPFNVDKVNSKTLQKVVEYLVFAHANPVPEVTNTDELSESKRKTIKAWETEFVPKDPADCINLIYAAHWLDLKYLQNFVTGVMVDTYLIDKSPEEIKKTFNIKGNLTPEIEEQLKKDNPWARVTEEDIPRPEKKETETEKKSE